MIFTDQLILFEIETVSCNELAGASAKLQGDRRGSNINHHNTFEYGSFGVS